MIDLHVHSCYSDGTDTPAQLVSRAQSMGVKALALTDHDTTAGTPAFLEECRKHRMTAFSGVEISASSEKGTLHLLGLGINPGSAALAKALENVRDGRAWRNQRIVERLNTLGLPLEMSEIARLAGDEVVARPHIAQAILQRGRVGSIQEAFDRYLAKGAAAYVDRFRLAAAEAIALIRSAGGVAVIAHPYSWHDDTATLEPALLELVGAGLGGIEAHYTMHSDAQTAWLVDFAKKHNLIITGGSDYHGLEIKPENEIGSGRGGLCVPADLLPPIFSALGTNGNYHREAAP